MKDKIKNDKLELKEKTELFNQNIESFNNETSERLKNRRLELNISLQKLSEMTKISKSTLQRYEKNPQGIPINKLKDIAKELNCPPGYFMGLESKELPYQYYRNIVDLIKECNYNLEYNSSNESFSLTSELNVFEISPDEMKKLTDEIKSYTKYKITELIIKNTPHVVDDYLK